MRNVWGTLWGIYFVFSAISIAPSQEVPPESVPVRTTGEINIVDLKTDVTISNENIKTLTQTISEMESKMDENMETLTQTISEIGNNMSTLTQKVDGIERNTNHIFNFLYVILGVILAPLVAFIVNRFLIKKDDTPSPPQTAAVTDTDRTIYLKSDNNNAEAYNRLGTAKRELGQNFEAISDFNEAIRLKPDFAEAYYNRGVAKHVLNHLEDSIADLNIAIHLKPDYGEAYYNRGVAKRLLNHLEDSIADLNIAIHLKLDYGEAYYNRARSKSELGRIEEAREDFNKALELTDNPDIIAKIQWRLEELDPSE